MTIPPALTVFLEHLDELRRRLVKCLGAFFLAFIACFNYAPHILAAITAPAGTLIFTTPGGGFSAVMNVSATMALISASPIIIYQLWAFAATGLLPHEKKYVYLFGSLSLFFFLAGVTFAYCVAVPMAYHFLMGFATPQLQPMITIDHYLGFLGNMVLAFGVAFELPLIMAFLAKVGIATPQFLRSKRRHAIVVILIIAAILTPPDIASQLLLAVPLLFLYELGIVFAGICAKKS